MLQTTGGAAPGRRQRHDRPTSGAAAGQGTRRKKGTTPALTSVPASQWRTVGLRRRPACCDAGRLCARGQALECGMDVRWVARTGVCARVMPTPGSRESRWKSSQRCRLLCVASSWVSRCETVVARGLRHAGELLAATICASLRAARGPRVCGASGARPRSRFPVDLSGGDRSKSCTERGGMQQLCAKFRASDFACEWLPD